MTHTTPGHVKAWRRTRSDASRERMMNAWYDRGWVITIGGQAIQGKLVRIDELAFVTDRTIDPAFTIEVDEGGETIELRAHFTRFEPVSGEGSANPQHGSRAIAQPEDTGEQERVQMLREALAPYLCLDSLRRLAARGENLVAALRSTGSVPDEVRAIISLLAALLSPASGETIRTPADIAALLMLEMGGLDHEEFWIVCLDTKNHVQRIHRLYKGSLNSSVVRIAEVFRLPMALNSASIIVAHSHPSGSTEASPEDLDVTRSLIQVGELLQIEVLDHLIIAQGRWLSMREHRLGW